MNIRFSLRQIQTNEVMCKIYLQILYSFMPTSLLSVKQKAHEICPELGEYCSKNLTRFTANKAKDKGLAGKYIEFFLFGNLPNCDSKPDLSFGDIKTTHLKSLKRGGYNAKERLTITNCGTTADYDSFNSIVTFFSILCCCA